MKLYIKEAPQEQNSMKKYVFTESQLKKIIDNQVSESEEKKEFRPGVNLGKYNLKSFLKDKDDDTDEEKDKDEKKPFSTNRLKSEKKKED
jgi:hypothetical protein